MKAEMKICPKCNKKMKKALQVTETEATWWDSEEFYVADPNGKSRIYEKCLTCGTELQEHGEEWVAREGSIKPDEMKREFEEVHSRLKRLQEIYTRERGDFHQIVFLKRPDAKLYSELLSLGREGLKIVRQHHDYFSNPEHRLYDDGMFWYSLFEMTSSAALQVRKHRIQRNIKPNVLKELTEILVDISEFSTVNPAREDIIKRNHEALGDTLIAFYSSDLINMVQKRGCKIGLKPVNEFVSWTIGRVKDIGSKKRDDKKSGE